MGPGKDKANMTVHGHAYLQRFIASRGLVHEWSASKYARKIIQYWVAIGAPPVCEQDVGKDLPAPPAALMGAISDWWRPGLDGGLRLHPTKAPRVRAVSKNHPVLLPVIPSAPARKVRSA